MIDCSSFQPHRPEFIGEIKIYPELLPQKKFFDFVEEVKTLDVL